MNQKDVLKFNRAAKTNKSVCKSEPTNKEAILFIGNDIEKVYKTLKIIY